MIFLFMICSEDNRPHQHIVHSCVGLAVGHMDKQMYTVTQSLMGRGSFITISGLGGTVKDTNQVHVKF